jgi:hypothetical protein
MDRRCSAKNKAGDPCRATPLKGREWCSAHDPDLPESARFKGGAKKGAGRPRNPRATDVLRDQLERLHAPALQALEDALTATRGYVVGSGDSAELELIPDHALRLTAARDVLDRINGKARQAIEHTGPDGGPVQIDAPPDATDRALRASQLLAKAGALNGSTNGASASNGAHH